MDISYMYILELSVETTLPCSSRTLCEPPSTATMFFLFKILICICRHSVSRGFLFCALLSPLQLSPELQYQISFFQWLDFQFFFVFSLQITCHESFSFLVSSLGPDQRKSTQSFSISLRHALGNQKAAIKKFVRLVITEFINCSLPAQDINHHV